MCMATADTTSLGDKGCVAKSQKVRQEGLPDRKTLPVNNPPCFSIFGGGTTRLEKLLNSLERREDGSRSRHLDVSPARTKLSTNDRILTINVHITI